LQASRLKVTQIMPTKTFGITPSETEFEIKIQLSDSKFEFAWGVAN